MGLPHVARDDHSAPFFDGARRGELLVLRCENGHHLAPTQGYNQPAVRCHECRSDILDWAPVSGRGALVTWTVIHLKGAEPATQIAGVVELDEGPWLKALIDVPTDEPLRAGTEMTVGFVETDDGGELIPAFRPT
jgi:uncharacterized OB-fold protein